jgi:predicted HTH domain antitoxin
MVAEVFAGISSLKMALDIAKGLKDIDDATRRNAAIIELQEKILSAQAAQAELVETMGELKKRVIELETWDTEKQRYELKELGPGLFCYAVKETIRGSEPFHCLCANCYGDRKKSFLQKRISGEYYDEYRCNSCDEKIGVKKGTPPRPSIRHNDFL